TRGSTHEGCDSRVTVDYSPGCDRCRLAASRVSRARGLQILQTSAAGCGADAGTSVTVGQPH
ncbi:hypothetical protein KI387_007628, partial [Taxus chinensis]